jgi:hypothetical protein
MPPTTTLPPALDKSRHSIDEEVAFARSLSPEQRLGVLAAVCRADLQLLLLNRHRERLLAHRDPVPSSTVAAFRRLRTS